ncbi:MAG: LytR C-terminal domain-containing protein [Candidatus Dojkabacteria bacterium]|nr:MAG: LytR C-terminal domain-containing protein [Candidatus Dojkabacteria bacterium]
MSPKVSKRKNQKREASTRRTVEPGRRPAAKSTKSANRYLQLLPKLILIVPVLFLIYKVVDFASFYRNVEVGDVVRGQNASIIDIEREKEVQRVALIIEDDSQETHISFVSYMLLNTESGKGMVIYIPGWVYMEPYSDGIESKYKLADLLYLSKIVAPENPYQLALHELENNLAMEIDDYIWFEPGAFQHMQEISNNKLVAEGDAQNIHTLLDTFSRINLFFNASSAENLFQHTLSSYSFVNIWSESNKFNALIDSGSVEIIEVSGEWGVVEEALPIGKTIYVYGFQEVDAKIAEYRELVRKKDVQKEQTKIEVFNGSEVSGLAGKYARRFDNAGIEVIRVDNAVELYDKSTLYISSPEKYDDSLEVVKAIVADAAFKEVDEIVVVESRPHFLTTGDIVVVLGKDVK